MLFAGLKGKYVTLFAIAISGLADDTSWHLTYMLLFTSYETNLSSAVVTWIAKALARTANDISTKLREFCLSY